MNTPSPEIKRQGCFSSSKISDLCSKGRGNLSIENTGKPFDTYIEEKVFERLLQRQLNKEQHARATSWGKLVEEYAFDKLGLEYSLVSRERYAHNKFGEYWNGMPDLLTEEIVGDIKCPYTIKSFCSLYKSMKAGPEALKASHPSYYWQLVSNAILCDRKTAMLVVYVPYKEDLEAIRELAREHAGDLDNRFAFVNWSEDEELPFLIDGGFYSDLNSMEFEVPEHDKEFLEERVAMAIKELEKQLLTYTV
jgi:hypothetical protein